MFGVVVLRVWVGVVRIGLDRSEGGCSGYVFSRVMGRVWMFWGFVFGGSIFIDFFFGVLKGSYLRGSRKFWIC